MGKPWDYTFKVGDQVAYHIYANSPLAKVASVLVTVSLIVIVFFGLVLVGKLVASGVMALIGHR